MEEPQDCHTEDLLARPGLSIGTGLPAGFMPLRLMLEPLGLWIEVHGPEVIVGRHSSADVRLALPDISRRHCRLVYENQHWRVVDMNSLNGVFINGARRQEAALHHGDRLQIGTFSFRVDCGSAGVVHKRAS